mmetsp:Transcript_41403/g.103351  ORF Transcript_41403/g.103351 Transcript_41403/m.103351 type:complete len:201 (+) Transcript_41403:649-1251(+)
MTEVAVCRDVVGHQSYGLFVVVDGLVSLLEPEVGQPHRVAQHRPAERVERVPQLLCQSEGQRRLLKHAAREERPADAVQDLTRTLLLILLLYLFVECPQPLLQLHVAQHVARAREDKQRHQRESSHEVQRRADVLDQVLHTRITPVERVEHRQQLRRRCQRLQHIAVALHSGWGAGRRRDGPWAERGGLDRGDKGIPSPQ